MPVIFYFICRNLLEGDREPDSSTFEPQSPTSLLLHSNQVGASCGASDLRGMMIGPRRLLIRAIFLAVFFALLAQGGIIHAQTVNVWLTTANQQTKLEQQASVDFVAAGTTGNPVIVDEALVYQQIEGFGGSFTDSSAYLLNQVASSTDRNSAMTNLFSRGGNGIGLSFIRNPMGACDYSRSNYTYDDGAVDTTLANFSIAHDQADIIPLVKQAIQLNPQLSIMASPWSPPGWMKSSNSIIAGTLLSSMYAPFANYFVKYIQAYQSNGIPIKYISLQNEPLYLPNFYPGMGMDAATQTIVLRDYVLPALTANSLTTKVLMYDHNWDALIYPQQMLADATLLSSPQVAGTAWHGYGGTPGAMTTLAAQYPSKGNYVTEHSGGTWVSNQQKSDFEEITQVMRNWGKAFVKWNIALDQNRVPFVNPTSACYPLVTVNNATGALSYTIEYYTLGHFSKFVLPGATRVYSNNGTGIVSSAFVNPDGSKVLVAYNDASTSQIFQVQWGAKQFNYTLAASDAVTFTWSGAQSGGYTVDARLPIQASSFNSTSGLQTENSSDIQGGYDVGYSDNSDYAVYKNVDFGSGLSLVNIRSASAASGGTIEFRLDSPTGTRIATHAVTSTGGWQTWQTYYDSVSGASGVHDLYVVFLGGNGIANLGWFQFSTSSASGMPYCAIAASAAMVTPGQNAIFYATATGTPAPALRWQRLPFGGSTWSDLNDAGSYSGTGTEALTVSGATVGMNGDQFRCVATNSVGSGTSNVATLATAVPAVAPAVTTQPVSQTIALGASVTFTAAANGLPAPTYQWKKGGVNISGATGPSYTITSTVPGDEGSYMMLATNSAGSALSNAANLTINALPIFTTQPLSQPAFVGSTVNFVSLAASSTSLSYRWQKGGIDIPGAASATLTIPNLQLTDASSYAVIATNAVGATTSRFARLVVLISQQNAIIYATTVSSTGVTAGGIINLDYFITNVGTKTWGTNHYLSIRNAADSFVAFSPLIGILPGETTTAHLNFAAPSTPGTYTYYVQGLENGVEFFSTQTAVVITVLAPLTNSITYNTTTFPVSAQPSSTIIFTYNVTNTGTRTWGANHVLSLNDNNSTVLSFTPLTVLTPGSSKTVNLSFVAPSAPGTYPYTVEASQTGTGNFNTHADLTLTVLAPRPNAIVYTTIRAPDVVAPGASVSLNYSLSNAGTQVWGAGHFASLRDANQTFLAFIPLSGVAPGGNRAIGFSFTAPTTPGIYTYFTQAFEDGVEFFPTQNIVILTVATLPLANAITYNGSTFPVTVAPGATVSFSYGITNRGTKTWGATDYLTFRDVDDTFLGFINLSGIALGSSKTVNIGFTAPAIPGTYTYRMQGMEDGVAFYEMTDTLVLFVQ